MKLRDATIEDFAAVEGNNAFPEHYQKEPNQTVYSVALEEKGEVVAVGGLILITANTAWVWCDLTTLAEKHKIELIRNMKNYLNMMIVELGLSRLQAWVDEYRPEAKSLMKHLGFTEEFVMHDFLGFGHNAVMYIKLTGG